MRLVRGLGFTSLVGALMLGSPSSLWAGNLVLEAEVMESSEEMAIPGAGSAHVRSAVIHHKHERDQAAFSEWLRGHQSGGVGSCASCGGGHQGLLFPVEDCFGGGVVVFTPSVSVP